jgi:hypothetical protein
VRLARIDPPGGLTDLLPEGQEAWSDRVSRLLDAAIPGDPHTHDGPRTQFYNPIKTDTADDAKVTPIFWFAFPRLLLVTTTSDRARWTQADADRDNQDEYCEWSVQRNDAGKITRVTFTTETPEYFEELAVADPARLLALYREFVSADVQAADLLTAGQYNPRNEWNRDTKLGPMHLIQGNNNLGAAVELAAAATIVRHINGLDLVAEQELIACSKYGEPRRNSDPHIGAGINSLARADADVTLANPPGLYLLMLSTGGWSTPDGTDPKTFWKWQRGAEGMRLRAIYEVPADKKYVVGDITINGRPIEFGGQIADFVTVTVRGLACRIGQSKGQPFTTCRT